MHCRKHRLCASTCSAASSTPNSRAPSWAWIWTTTMCTARTSVFATWPPGSWWQPPVCSITRLRPLWGASSEEEFSLHGLGHLQGPILEIGRTCVDPAYRNGGTIAVLWSELAEILNEGAYSYLMGCASIPMHDGGIQAHAIMQRLRERYLCTEHLRAEPKNPLPTLDLPSNVICEMPPLLKAYMRLGAKICGEPCWDEDFQVADVFILLKRDELCPRYARHFKAAV